MSDPCICDRLDFEFYDLVLWLLNQPTTPNFTKVSPLAWCFTSWVRTELLAQYPERGKVIEDQNKTSRISTIDSKRHLVTVPALSLRAMERVRQRLYLQHIDVDLNYGVRPKETKVRQTQRTTGTWILTKKKARELLWEHE